jgi:hypothetical protein
MGIFEMATIWRARQTKDDVLNGFKATKSGIFPDKISVGVSMFRFGRDLG